MPTWLSRGNHAQEKSIETTIWFALGAVLGLTAFKLTGASGTQSLLEDVLVGVFAAFIGGEFVAPALLGKTGTGSMFAVSLGVTVTALIGLHFFRRKLGPQRPHQKRRRA